MWPFRAKTRMMDSSVLASAHGRSLLRREASFITQKSRGSVINTSTSQTRYVHMGPHTTLHLRSECKPSCCLYLGDQLLMLHRQATRTSLCVDPNHDRSTP